MKKSQTAKITDQHTIGPGLDEHPEDAQLVRFLNPGRGEVDRGAVCLGHLHRLAILANIGEVRLKTSLPEFEHGAQLWERPHQNVERGRPGLLCSMLRVHLKRCRPGRRPASGDPPRRQGHDRLFQPRNQGMPELAEHAVRHHRSTRDLSRERPQLEGRATQSRQLRLQGLAGDRVLCRCDRGLVRLDQTSSTAHHRRLDPHGLARRGGHVQVDGRPSPGIGQLKGLAEAGGEMGVVGLPDGLPHLHGGEIDGPMAKREFHLTARHRFREGASALKHLVDAAPFRIIHRPTAVEGQSIAALHASHEIDHHAVPADSHHGAELHATFRAARGRHQHFMIAAAKPTW